MALIDGFPLLRRIEALLSIELQRPKYEGKELIEETTKYSKFLLVADGAIVDMPTGRIAGWITEEEELDEAFRLNV